tara:strand:+ start:532 stop:1182 length:651 start_codon:yes stop_codon:yes gene_type:complete
MKNNLAIFLDFDGTILDNLPQMYLAYEDFMSDIGQKSSQEEFDEGNGVPLRKSLNVMKKKYFLSDSVDYLENKYHEFIAIRTASVKPRHGLEFFLDKEFSKGKKISIVSSNRNDVIKGWLEKYNLSSYISFICSSESVKNGKPNAEPYITAMKQLEVSPSHCIAIEDSCLGVLSSTNAGIQTIQIINKTGSLNAPSELASNVVNNFDEIQSIVDAI